MNANRSTGQVLVERLQKYSHLLGAAEKLGIGKEFHHRVWEILEVAEILYRERQITDAEFQQIQNVKEQYEQSYSAVEFVFDAA